MPGVAAAWMVNRCCCAHRRKRSSHRRSQRRRTASSSSDPHQPYVCHRIPKYCRREGKYRKMAAAASPGSGSFTSSDWIVLRDGCLRCDEEGLRSLSYHPALNAILAVTSRGSIKVVDGTSGAVLQASALHGEDRGPSCPIESRFYDPDCRQLSCQLTLSKEPR